MKHVIYQPEGVCSRKIDFDLTDEGTIANCRFSGGCSGNLLAISKLIEGQKATEVVRVLLGNHCADNPTSCADQLARAIQKNL